MWWRSCRISVAAQSGADGSSSSVPVNEGAVRAATRNTERAARSAFLLFLPAGLLGLACMVVALSDLAYLIKAGGVPTRERAEEMNACAGWLANLGWLAFAVGTGAFTRWNQACTRAASLFSARPRPAAGFALFRPYEQLRALDESLDPDRVDIPARPDAAEHAGGYRSAAVDKLRAGTHGAGATARVVASVARLHRHHRLPVDSACVVDDGEGARLPRLRRERRCDGARGNHRRTR